MRKIPLALLSFALAALAFLSGCANNQPKPVSLYQWQAYQRNVDAYFQGDGKSIEAQIVSMEEGLQKIQSDKAVVPPGYLAHLGLLYAKQGKLTEFQQQISAEKEYFPESGIFVEFLVRNFKK